MKRLLTSCFGLGHLPIAPGTWGSLPPVIIFYLLGQLHAAPMVIAAVMIVLAIAASVICIKFAPDVIAATGKSDPSEVVVDEVAGQAVTYAVIALALGQSFADGRIWIIALSGFFLFRFFDILKPWPIRRLEKLSQGWGILADDLLAGLYAAITLIVCYKFFCCRTNLHI